MIKIEYACPMIVSLLAVQDMTQEQAKTAMDLFRNRLAVKGEGNTLRLVKANSEEAAGAICGPEAVIAYRKSLGLKENALESVPVYEILELADDFDDAGDLLYLMRRVCSRNERVKRLKELNAPAIIMQNEIRMLWEAVEKLYFNRFTPNPLTYTFDTEDGKETYIRKSLIDMLMREDAE